MLSKKEIMVLAARFRGLGVKQIADELELSIHTVRHHIESIHIKLAVHSLQQAICVLVGNHCLKCQGGLFALFQAESDIGQSMGNATNKRRTPRARIPCPGV